MEQHIPLSAKTHNGTISIHTEIPAPGDADTCVVTIGVTPQSTLDPATQRQALEALDGALADTPLPKVAEN
jgi:hypothetical protein